MRKRTSPGFWAPRPGARRATAILIGVAGIIAYLLAPALFRSYLESAFEDRLGGKVEIDRAFLSPGAEALTLDGLWKDGARELRFKNARLEFARSAESAKNAPFRSVTIEEGFAHLADYPGAAFDLAGLHVAPAEGGLLSIVGRVEARIPIRDIPSPVVFSSGTARAAFSAAFDTSGEGRAHGKVFWEGLVISTRAAALKSDGQARVLGLRISSGALSADQIELSSASTSLSLYYGEDAESLLRFDSLGLEARALGRLGWSAEGRARTDLGASLKGNYDSGARKLRLDLRGLQLPPFSAFFERANGNRVVTGSLDALVDARIDGALSGKARIKIRGLELDWIRPAKREETARALGMHLSTLIALLRGKEGDIDLEVPFELSPEGFSYGFAGAASKLLRRGLVQGAVFAAEAALPPLKAARWAAKGAGLLFRWRIPPIPFAESSEELGEEALAILREWGPSLAGKKELRLKVCGAFAKDAEQDPQLASRRAALIRDHLIREFGLDPGQLLVCEPEAGERSEVLLSLF